MPAYTKPEHAGELIVTFPRVTDQDQTVRVPDGQAAAAKAIVMITRRAPLRPGDLVVIRRADDLDALEQSAGAELPEPSRASHLS